MNPYGGGWGTFTEPLSTELQAFPRACAEAAERLGKSECHEITGSTLSRAGEFIAGIALDHLSNKIGQHNAGALGISPQELMKIEAIVFIPPGGVGTAAQTFVTKYMLLIRRLADAMANYESGPGAREVVLL